MPYIIQVPITSPVAYIELNKIIDLGISDYCRIAPKEDKQVFPSIIKDYIFTKNVFIEIFYHCDFAFDDETASIMINCNSTFSKN